MTTVAVSQCQHLESGVERSWPLCNSHTWRAWCFRCAPVGEGPAWWVNVPGYGSERETRERLKRLAKYADNWAPLTLVNQTEIV